MSYGDASVKVEGFDLTRGQVLEINCAACGARPSERCVTEGGNERLDPHIMRKSDRQAGRDPGPTRTRTQRMMESMQEIGHAYLTDVLRRAVDKAIITDSQRSQILALTDRRLTPQRQQRCSQRRLEAVSGELARATGCGLTAWPDLGAQASTSFVSR